MPEQKRKPILMWCPYGQSCKGSICQLWEANEEECMLRLKSKYEIKLLLLQLRGVKK